MISECNKRSDSFESLCSFILVRYLCGVFTKTYGNRQKIPQRTERVKTLSGLGLLDLCWYFMGYKKQWNRIFLSIRLSRSARVLRLLPVPPSRQVRNIVSQHMANSILPMANERIISNRKLMSTRWQKSPKYQACLFRSYEKPASSTMRRRQSHHR